AVPLDQVRLIPFQQLFHFLDMPFCFRFDGLAPFHEFVADRNFHRSTFGGKMRKKLPLAVSCADAWATAGYQVLDAVANWSLDASCLRRPYFLNRSSKAL